MMPAVSDNAATTLERVQESEVERQIAGVNRILALDGFSEDATEDVNTTRLSPLPAIRRALNGPSVALFGKATVGTAGVLVISLVSGWFLQRGRE